jgi:acyl-CoA reductase-like NAD-dependent aldehyde dehydrogenase
MLKPTWPFYLANRPESPNADLEVIDKYTGEVATRVAMASAADIDRAIDAAVHATEPMARMPSYARQAVLEHCVSRFRERFDELAESLCIEAGKPIKDAEGEVGRLIDTFKIAAEESTPGSTARSCRWTSRRAPGATGRCGSGCRSGRARSSRRSTSR